MLKMKKLGASNGTKSKEGFNLLESSDSESTEHFSLPAMKTKTRGPKKGGKCCSCCSVVVFLGLVLVLVSVFGLGYITYNLKSELRKLKEKMPEASNANSDVTDEVTTLQTQLQQFKTDIETLKTSKDDMQKIIDTLNQKITSLNRSTSDLQHSVAQAPALSALPETVKNLQTQVADLGSSSGHDISQLKTDVKQISEDLKNTQSAVEDLTEKVNSEPPSPGSSSAPASSSENVDSKFEQKLKNVTATLNTLTTFVMQNMTAFQRGVGGIITNVTSLQSNITVLDSRLGLLEISSSMPPPSKIDTQDMQVIVQEAVNSVMDEIKNFTLDTGKEAQDEMMIIVQNKLDNVTTRVDHLELAMNELESSSPQEGSTSSAQSTTQSTSTQSSTLATSTQSGEVIDLKQHVLDTETAIQSLNGQFTLVNESLEDVFIRIARNTDRIIALENTMTSFSPPDGGAPGGQGGGPADILPPAFNPPPDDTPNPEDKVVNLDDIFGNYTDEFSASGVNPADDDDTLTETPEVTVSALPTVPPTARFNISFIKTKADVLLNFHRWDRDGDGKVGYAELHDFLGPNLPPESEFMKYDKNKDRKYTIEEVYQIFGFSPETDNVLVSKNIPHPTQPASHIPARNQKLPFPNRFKNPPNHHRTGREV